MKVKVRDLQLVAEQLFAHLEAGGVEEIELPCDYYWNVPDEALCKVYEHPKELSIGQLSEDLRQLSRIQNGEASPVGYALVWLAAVLKCVGAQSIA